MPRQWPDEVKREAACYYAVNGSYKQTSALVGVPHNTIHQWATGKADKAGVFVHQLEESRNERTTSFIAKYEAIAEQSLDKLNVRLQDDSVSAKDLITIAGISTDKSLILAGKPNRVTANQSMQDLAKLFADLSSQHVASLQHDTSQEGQMGPLIEAPKGQSEPD
jgi:transposase-like protein